VETSVDGCGAIADSVAFGAAPVSVNERQLVLPKQPAVVCPDRRDPSGSTWSSFPWSPGSGSR
jgi:hypothetical protein